MKRGILKPFKVILILNLFLTGCFPLPNPPSKAELITPESGINFPLQEKWCLRGDSVFSLPTYYEGLIYIILEPVHGISNLTAYDLEGNLIWAKEIKNDYGYLGLPGYWLFSSDYLVIEDDNSTIVLNRKTGESIWSQTFYPNKGMTIGDGRVYVSTNEEVIALDLKTGKQIWKIPEQGRTYGEAPIYIENENRKYLLIDQAPYQLVDAFTGEAFYVTNSTIDFGHPPDENRSIVYGNLYIRPTNRGIEVLDVLSGKMIKSFEGPRSLFPQLIEASEQSLFLNTVSSIAVLDLAQMKFIWGFTFSNEQSINGLKVYSNPFEFQGNVYVILSDASIRAFDLKNGIEVGKWQDKKVANKLGSLTPFIPGFGSSENLLFVSFGTNEVCAFGGK